MKVFLSWSGTKSRLYAEVFNKYISIIIPGIETFMSSEEIDKGMRWGDKIAKELHGTDYGILFVTNDNVSSSWLNFEAGALSKSIDAGRVAPLLIDAKIEELAGTPISQFQASLFDKDELKKLIISIAKSGSTTKVEIVSQYFEKFWADIEREIEEKILLDSSLKKSPEPSALEKTLNEISNLIKRQNSLISNPDRLLPAAHIGKAISRFGDVPAHMKKMADYIEETDKLIDKIKDVYLFGIDPDDIEELREKVDEIEDLIRDHELFETRD